jgi:hypothetical protein
MQSSLKSNSRSADYKFPGSVDPEGPLPRSQEYAIGPYREPDECNLRLQSVFLQYSVQCQPSI